MALPVDSLRLLKQQIDSLNEVLTSTTRDEGWFKISEAPVQAATIVACATIVTVILGFIFKDFFIPHWIEIRNKRKEGERLFALYKMNAFWAAFNFNNRIYEIYGARSHYLWKTGSMNTFYDYKYKSSVFRLCVLFAWIKAYKLLQSKMSIDKDQKRTHLLNGRIHLVESAFADGQRVEMYIIKTVLDILNVDMSSLKPRVIEQLSIEADHLLHESLKLSGTEHLTEASEEIQDNFIADLSAWLEKLKIYTKPIGSLKQEIIEGVSIKLVLIYRDWQQAIGDLMLLKEGDDYTTISFKRFEEFWDQPVDSSEKRWLMRAESMFGNLNLTVDRKKDSRVEQLEIIYSSVYQLMKTLYDIKMGPCPISKTKFRDIKSTIISK